jgi:hypothetical protein
MIGLIIISVIAVVIAIILVVTWIEENKKRFGGNK